MKKSGLLMLFLILLLVSSRSALALDMGGYLENKLQVTDGQNMNQTNKLKLDFTMKADACYLFASLTAFNDFIQANHNEIELSRAYLELYPSWGKAAIGLQNIAWGNGYLFNLPDQFNPVNILDPKGEKAGINAVSVKWNISGTSLMEVVVVPAAPPGATNVTIAGCDYGIKGLWTIGRFDISVYTLKKTIVEPAIPSYTDRRAGVLELKGELGDDLPGVWAQGGWFADKPSATGAETTYISSVYGSDYTLSIGNGLYLLVEYLQDGKLDNNQLYFMTRYTTNGYLTVSLSGLWVLESDIALYSLILKYQLNDNVEFSGMANYYPQGSGSLGMAPNCVSEIVLGLKTTF